MEVYGADGPKSYKGSLGILGPMGPADGWTDQESDGRRRTDGRTD